MTKLDTARFNTLVDSFPYAMSVAAIIDAALDILKFDNRLKIIQIDAFPAIFTKNIFLALRDLKLGNKVEFIVQETNKNDFETLKSKINLNGLDIKYQSIQSSYLDVIGANEKVIILVNNFLSHHSQEDFLKLIKDLENNTAVELVIGVEKLSRKCDLNSAQLNSSFWSFDDAHLYHYVIANDPNVLDQLKPNLENQFVANNNTEKYLDLIRALNKACCPQAAFAVKLLMEEMFKLDGYSANNHFFLGRFYKIFGHRQKALENYQKTRLADSYGLIDVDSAIKQLQKS